MRRAWLGLGLVLAAGCDSSSEEAPGPVVTTPLADNVAELVVDSGPDGKGFANSLYATVTVCVPGTAQCQTIDHVIVDTGSVGLRIMGSVLNLPLPKLTDSAGSPMAECAQFVSGYCWGPLHKADLKLAGEVAADLTVHVVETSPYRTPSPCTGEDVSSVEKMGANGILGIGPLAQDCGSACAIAPGPGSLNPELYFACSDAAEPCRAQAVSLADQVVNPVTRFAQDNNGTIVELPSIPGHSAAWVKGALIFGIGTRDNNRLDQQTVLAASESGSVLTAYPVDAARLSPAVFDTGSNGLYFSDPATSGIPACENLADFYCPSRRTNHTALVFDSTAQERTAVAFSVGNLEVMAQKAHAAFDDLAGPNSGAQAEAAGFSAYFDWGLPFYYGRRVFTAIEGQATPRGTGPYFAF